MSDDNRNDDNVVTLRPRSSSSPPDLPPIPGAAPSAPPPPSDPPAVVDDDGAAVPRPRSRRSATDSLRALTAGPPGLPPASTRQPATAVRAEGLDDGEAGDSQEPGLVGLGLAATLAIALAALRGTATVVSDWRQRRMERAEELAPLREARLKNQLAGEETAAKHQLAMQNIGDKAAQQRSKIPSSQDFGRKAAGGRGSPPGAGRGSDGGSGRPSNAGAKTPMKPKGSSSTASTPTGSGKKTSPDGSKGSSGKQPGANASGRGVIAPSGGRSPSTKHSPALERAKGRNDRKAARQAAGLAERAQDRRQAAKDARQEAKAGRAAAKKEKAAADARTTFGAAVQDEAARRLAKRRKNLSSPVFSKTKRKKDKGKGGDGTEASASGDATPPKVDLTKKPKKAKAAAEDRTTFGAAVHEEAARRLAKRRMNLSSPVFSKTKRKKDKGKKGKGAKDGGPAGRGPSDRRRRKERAHRAKERATAGSTSDGYFYTATDNPYEGTYTSSDRDYWGWPPRGERRSAYDSVRDTDPYADVTVTAESLHVPGSKARRWAPAAVTAGTPALAAAAAPAPASSPIKKGAAPVSASASVSIPTSRTVSAEHLTEVTLDDVLDALADAKDECLTTYDECAVLADKAVALRDSLRELAVELAERNNVIGRLTSAAMRRLAESMDVLKKRAQEMRKESLAASEAVETAHDEMYDAYRPVQQAAFNAGLTMPSARIHNED